jgi:hypothetical protein
MQTQYIKPLTKLIGELIKLRLKQNRYLIKVIKLSLRNIVVGDLSKKMVEFTNLFLGVFIREKVWVLE